MKSFPGSSVRSALNNVRVGFFTPQLAAVIAVVLAAAPMTRAVSITWDSTSDVSQLQILHGIINSLFPGFGHNDGNVVTVSDGPISVGYVTGAASEDADVFDNTVRIKAGADIRAYLSGADSNTGKVSNNKVVMEAGIVNGRVHGGYSHRGDVAGNSVTISGGTVRSDIYGGYSYGGGDTTGNSVVVSGINSVNARIYGGYSSGGSANSSDNTVSVTAVDAQGIVGGRSASINFDETVRANRNIVTLSRGDGGGEVTGGHSVVRIALTDGDVGDLSSDGNQVTLSDGASAFLLRGGHSHVFVSGLFSVSVGDISASGNTVTLIDSSAISVVGGESSIGSVSGGDVMNRGDAIADGNVVQLSGATVVGSVRGGLVTGGQTSPENDFSASGNMVTLSDNAHVTSNVSAGSAYNQSGYAIANNNTVTIADNATVDGHVYGGDAHTGSPNGFVTANNNTVIVAGGTVLKNIYGGYSAVNFDDTASTATGNTVTIHAEADVSQSIIYGGYAGNDYFAYPNMDARTGNTLNLYGNGIMAVGVVNFQYLNFYVMDEDLPGLLSSTSMLTIVDALTLIAGDVIAVDFSGITSLLSVGDRLSILNGDIIGYEDAVMEITGLDPSIYTYDYGWDASGKELWVTITGVVPEPAATAVLLGLAVLGVALLRWTRPKGDA